MYIEVIGSAKRYRIQAEAGTGLLACLLREGIIQTTECSGMGVCGKCAVMLHSGELASSAGGTIAQELREDGKILACRCLIKEDVVIEIASTCDDTERKARLPNLHKGNLFSDPPVVKKYIQMEKPTLRDQASDLDRILAQVGKTKRAPVSLLKNLPEMLRKADFQITATIIDDEIIDIEPGDTQRHKYGFILDIGTTTIATYLVDLHTGDILEADGAANPQRAFGSDVLSRISAASASEEQLNALQSVTLDAVSQSMRSLLRRHGLEERNVYSMIVVGNTTMSHLFLGVDPKNLAVAPFIPCYRTRTTMKGGALGLPMHPEGELVVLPNISGYVGSDTMGVAMATKPWELPGYSLAVDIGTNGEIILGYKGWVLACSAAAGPAFEGAHIQNGMRAGDGAIESVRFENDTIRLEVICNTPPQGICGSGLIDAVAELLRVGLLNARGRLADAGDPVAAQPLGARLRVRDTMREFVLVQAGELGSVQDIVITQKDIRELQLAKAAIAAGIAILMKEAKIDASRIDRLFLAGAFGNYLNPKNAVALGMFPGIPGDKIFPVGNAAAEGAGLCLLSTGQRKMADRIAMFVKPVELSARVDFNEEFVREIGFPPVE